MIRHRLTDEQWDLISSAMPKPKRTGRPPRDYREMIDGIFWILHTGSAWRDLPGVFGPWSTVWDVFDKWNHDGTLQAILDLLRGQVKIDEDLWCIDGTIVRAARCASGGGKKGIRMNRRTTPLGAREAV